MTLPPYIEYPGNISYKQPFNLNNTEIYGFVVTGQTAAMQAMVDARLNFMNNRPDTKYFIATDKAIMTYTNSPCGQSTTNDGDKGMFTEITFICYTVVAECKKRSDGKWYADRLLIFIPYIIVDTPFSMIGGRENYGFPKSFGQFVLPNDPAFVNNLACYTIAIKQFSPDASSYLQPFTSVSKIVDGQSSTGETFSDQTDFSKKLISAMKPKDVDFHLNLGFFIEEAKDLWNLRIPMVFLKQFRDVADATKACYQAIIEGNGYLKKLRGGNLLKGKYQMMINHLDTHPIDKDLGLNAVNDVGHAFRIDCDIYFDNGTEIWRSV